MTKNLTFLLLFTSFVSFAQNRFTISGYVREKGSQELLIGVNVYMPNSSVGTSSNTYGFYSLTLPARDSVSLVFSFVGYERVVKHFSLKKNIEINLELSPTTQLSEVVVSAKKQEERISETAQMSQIEIPIQQIKKIPALLGEKDVLKVLQLMPGVQKGSEGQAGIYVRGGGPDQNLIMLDDAVVYNANHLFGFFSTFNGDALKSVELTKGGFPARFGGRLSSVIDLNMKEGNKEKLQGEGGIGIISSRLTLEGPIKRKNEKMAKSSFLISGRRTYIDVLSKPFIANAQKNATDKASGGYYFYDLNAKVNYDFGKDKLYLSGYFGKDRFYANTSDATSTDNSNIDWGNTTATLRWNHQFTQKLFSNTSLIFSKYQFGIANQSRVQSDTTTNEYSLFYDSFIRDTGIKTDFDFFPNPKHTIRFGFLTTFHHFVPSAIVLQAFTQNYTKKANPLNLIESGIYAEDTWHPIDILKLNMGLRISQFKTQSKNYIQPEPRFSSALKLAKDLSFKLSYARMNQYVHLLSNTGIGLPTDLWVPTTDKVKPQASHQVASGFAKDFDKQGFTLTIEGYYKWMNNIVGYKEGASFLGLDGLGAKEVSWEDNITSGKGWSYGAEILLQKKVGKFSGWIGYTWSKTQWQFPELNFGKKFFPRYDRRHDASIVGIYELSPKITLSGTWVYGTGNALTLPIATYNAYRDNVRPPNSGSPFLFTWNSRQVNEYGEKNSFRAEAYHRLDFAAQFHKKKKHVERTFEVGVYNAYNRKNPFFYDIGAETLPAGTPATVERKTVLKRYSLFPAIPSITYSFKF